MNDRKNSKRLISTRIKRPYGTWNFNAEGASLVWDVGNGGKHINIKATDATSNTETEIRISHKLFLRILRDYAKSGIYAYPIEKSARKALIALAEAIETFAKK